MHKYFVVAYITHWSVGCKELITVMERSIDSFWCFIIQRVCIWNLRRLIYKIIIILTKNMFSRRSETILLISSTK